MDTETTWNEQIRAAVEATGETQRQLADRLGVDQSYLSRLLGGKIIPRLDTAERIGRALGFDLIQNGGATVEKPPALGA